jgi:hypothetical protein
MNAKFVLAIKAGVLSGIVYFLIMVVVTTILSVNFGPGYPPLFWFFLISTPVMGVISGLIAIKFALPQVNRKMDFALIGLACGIITSIINGIIEAALTVMNFVVHGAASSLIMPFAWKMLWSPQIGLILRDLIIIGLVAGVLSYIAGYIKTRRNNLVEKV